MSIILPSNTLILEPVELETETETEKCYKRQ